ncbi:MAG: RNA polymerase sigma factor [Chloroflexi bacterium]|nr:MAG: RNA polymerase sigma factor [Chloroflexota bacterium]MBL1195093.1 RNA polymerase sigma factor [Chloroflexota bacterium]
MPLDYSQRTDSELVQLAQQRGAKDNRAFNELFHRYEDYVYRQCYRSFGNAQDAEDMTQEIFFKAYRGLPGFAGRSSFKTWVFEITLNSCRNEIRRRSRRPVSAEQDIEEMEDHSLLPKQNLALMHGDQDQVESVLQQLKESERQALLLKDMQGLRYDEVAAEQNILLSAAKMRVMRARLAFRKIYLQSQAVEDEQ